MNVYKIGSAWPGPVPAADTPYLSLYSGEAGTGAELILFLNDPTTAEVEAVSSGQAKFAWISGEHGSLLAYRLGNPGAGGMPWSDVPYHWRDEQPARKGPPHEPLGVPGSPLLAAIIMVDRRSATVRAIRVTTWPTRAVDAIRKTLLQQATQTSTRAATDEWVDGLYARYAKAGTAQLVRERADLTWTGADADSVHAGTGEHANPQPAAGPDADPPAPSTPAALIARHVGGATMHRRYHSPLPEELAAWYCYVPDSGHNIAVVLTTHTGEGPPDPESLVPAPVRAVLRAGWTVRDGMIVCDLPYDDQFGLLDEHEETEY